MKKSNIEMLRELDSEYTPENRGFVSMDEIYLINKKLCLDFMNELDLRNLRDMVVMWYASRMNDEEYTIDEHMKFMDKMSAVTHVIDTKMYNLNLEEYM